MSGAREERLLWVDIAKSLGIFLIVFSHVNQTGFTEAFLWTFHVPLFFFISGLLTKPQSDRESLGRIAHKLALPYVYIYVLTTLLTGAWHADFDPGHLGRTLLGVVYGTHSYPDFVNAALWFLPSLITIEILYALVIRRWPVGYVICLAVSVMLFRRHALDLFFSIDLSLLGLNYFLAGVLVRRFELDRALARSRIALLATAIAGAAATSWAASVGNVWYAGEHYVLTLGAGLAGIAMIAGVSMLLASLLGDLPGVRAAFERVSANTLFIFCFHVFSNPAATALLAPLAPSPPFVAAVLISIVSIALLMPLAVLVRRYVPELVGLRRRMPATA
ncbi:MAG TPA: acyltransferase family protein [Steroidobacteraceae bacterium]|nr:acyltransferase family protein [Steroidobacteraceae bacterium]